MENKKTYYITTPIYYPSDKLHIGHTYCTVATDAFARYKRLRGYDVMFLTGTDEHGQKIEEKARQAGKTPQEFVDNIVCGEGGILDLWKLMNISNDRFIRTTDDYHVAAVQRIFKKMYDNGDIYKGAYKGKYCTPCESFWTESQLVNGMCPDCGRPVHDAEEEAYFFRLSKYAKPVQELLESGTFLEPASRVNEMINNFIKPGLEDLCVSRTSFTWGVPVDFDPGHVVYVWVDALFNYATALGYQNDRYDDYDKYWPPVNIVGKEIVRFHSIIWPAMLMSVGEPVPTKVYGHGWLVIDGRAALLPAAHLPLRLRRQLLQRAADQHHQHRPCQRPRQPRFPHHRHGREVLRRQAARRARERRLRRGADRPDPLNCRKVRRADGQLPAASGSGGGLQAHPARQQVYRRDHALGAGEGPGQKGPSRLRAL